MINYSSSMIRRLFLALLCVARKNAAVLKRIFVNQFEMRLLSNHAMFPQMNWRDVEMRILICNTVARSSVSDMFARF